MDAAAGGAALVKRHVQANGLCGAESRSHLVTTHHALTNPHPASATLLAERCT